MGIAVPGPPKGPEGPQGPDDDSAQADTAHDVHAENDEATHKATVDSSSEASEGDGLDPAARLSQIAKTGREKLLADSSLIEAMVRIDEIEVAARFIDKQREDLVTYAIDLREAVAEAMRARGDEVGELPEDDSDELG